MLKNWNEIQITTFEKNIQQYIVIKYTKEFNKVIKKANIHSFYLKPYVALTNISVLKTLTEQGNFNRVFWEDWINFKRKTRKIFARFLSRSKYEKKFNKPINKDYFIVINASKNIKTIFLLSTYSDFNYQTNIVRLNNWIKRTKNLNLKRLSVIYNTRNTFFWKTRVQKYLKKKHSILNTYKKYSLFNYNKKKNKYLINKLLLAMLKNNTEIIGTNSENEFISKQKPDSKTCLENLKQSISLKRQWLLDSIQYKNIGFI